MAERDPSQRALEQVEKITESESVNGEDLLESEDLKCQLRVERVVEMTADYLRRKDDTKFEAAFAAL